MFTKQEIQNEIYRLAPFHHNVELPYGLRTYIPELARRKVELTRVSSLVKHAFPALLDVCGGSLEGKRVLDVACNCGGFSVEAAKLGSQDVLGIDIVDHYLEQANFLKSVLKLDQLEFKKIVLEQIDETTIGPFDVTFCFGILYHLENPIMAMKRLSSVTKHIILVDTAVIQTPCHQEALWMMNFPGIADVQAVEVTTSLWRNKKRVVQFKPNEHAVIALLQFLGFTKVEKIPPKQQGLEQRYYEGTRATFLGGRSQ